MTRTLDKLRAEIDAVDLDLLAALAKRTKLVAEVAGAKAPGSAIFRPGREADLQVRLWHKSPKDSHKLIAPVWRPLLRASIASQKPDFTVAYPPDAETAAEVFGAGFLSLMQVAAASEGLNMLMKGTADICFVSAEDLATIGHQLGSETGIYVVTKEADWFLLASGLPDASETDVTIFAHASEPKTIELKSNESKTTGRKKGGPYIEFEERPGYFETVPDDLPHSHIIGIYQSLKL